MLELLPAFNWDIKSTEELLVEDFNESQQAVMNALMTNPQHIPLVNDYEDDYLPDTEATMPPSRQSQPSAPPASSSSKPKKAAPEAKMSSQKKKGVKPKGGFGKEAPKFAEDPKKEDNEGNFYQFTLDTDK